jgi:hypothetical protein
VSTGDYLLQVARELCENTLPVVVAGSFAVELAFEQRFDTDR